MSADQAIFQNDLKMIKLRHACLLSEGDEAKVIEEFIYLFLSVFYETLTMRNFYRKLN
jgi:hypothetical protein